MISLITSLYKSGDYLKKYFKGLDRFAGVLLKQNVNFEAIIIANEPTAEEKKILKEKSLNYDWLRVVEVKREPLYASWNRGVEMAKNEIVGFWNVDDIRYPGAVIDGISLINRGRELVYFPFVIKWHLNFLGLSFVIRRRTIYPPNFKSEEFTRSMHCGPFFIFTKSLYKKVGPFDEQFRIVGDFDWCIRAAKISKFELSKEIAGEFSVYRSSLSSGRNPLREAENNIIYKRHNILEKVKKGNDELESAYKINEILHSHKNL